MLTAGAPREAPTALPPPPTGETDPRRAALRRMRLLATLLLVLMTAIFIVTTAVKLDWPWIPLRARVCRSRHGRRLRRLVRDRRSVPAAARTADTAHGYRPRQQGPDRQGARQFHHQQFPYCRGDERKIGAHRYGGRARAVALRAGQCQAAGRLCRAAIAPDCKVPAAAAHRRIDRHNCAAGRAGGPGRAGGVEAVGDRVGAR